MTRKTAEQLPLLGPDGVWAKRFEAWRLTPNGRMAMNRFIRLAYGCNRRGIRLGAKAIWERLRWNFMMRKQEGELFTLNNNFTAYAARFAVEREPSLVGYFEMRRTAGNEVLPTAPECSRGISPADGTPVVSGFRPGAGQACAADGGAAGQLFEQGQEASHAG